MDKITIVKELLSKLREVVDIAQEEKDTDLEQTASIHFDVYQRALNYYKKFTPQTDEMNFACDEN